METERSGKTDFFIDVNEDPHIQSLALLCADWRITRLTMNNKLRVGENSELVPEKNDLYFQF